MCPDSGGLTEGGLLTSSDAGPSNLISGVSQIPLCQAVLLICPRHGMRYPEILGLLLTNGAALCLAKKALQRLTSETPRLGVSSVLLYTLPFECVLFTLHIRV